MSLEKAARKGEDSGRKHAASGAALTYENGIHHAKKAGFLSEDKINAFADGFVSAGKGGSAPRAKKSAGRPVGNLKVGRFPAKAAKPAKSTFKRPKVAPKTLTPGMTGDEIPDQGPTYNERRFDDKYRGYKVKNMLDLDAVLREKPLPGDARLRHLIGGRDIEERAREDAKDAVELGRKSNPAFARAGTSRRLFASETDFSRYLNALWAATSSSKAAPRPSRSAVKSTPFPESIGLADGRSLSYEDADVAFHEQEYQDFPQYRADKLYPHSEQSRLDYARGWEQGVQIALNNHSRNGRRRTRKHAGKGKRRRNGHCKSPRLSRHDASCDVLPGGAHDRLNRHVAGTSDGNIRDMRVFDAYWATRGGASPKGSHISPRALTSGQHKYMERAFYTPGLIGEGREQARYTSSQLRANKRKARLVFRKKR